jgi:hypothetical protein
LVLASLFACGTNTSTIPAGDFSGPTGLAIASLPDRDLLFVANQGANELRAIILCPANPAVATCGSNEEQQFLPGPIRLFPGSILVGERPLRLAGVPLLTSDTPPALHGAVLVAGLGVPDPTTGAATPGLQLVDAANLLAASRSKTVTAKGPTLTRLRDPTIDVVAVDQPGTSVVAIAATQSSNLSTAALTVLNVTIGSEGVAVGTVTRQCALDFAPTRLALIPGPSDLDTTGLPKHVYVADGTLGGTPGGIGDGLVEVSVPDIPTGSGSPPPPPLPCPVMRRIPASDPQDSPRRARPLKSIALNPATTSQTPPAPAAALPAIAAGSFILGVTVSDAGLCANHGTRVCPAAVNAPAGALCIDQGMLNCGAGRIVMLSNVPGGPSAVLDAPVPLTPATNPPSPPPPRLPLQPLRPPAAAREVSFMGRSNCPSNPQNLPSLATPCTAVRAGVRGSTNISTTPLLLSRRLIGLASAEDGSTNFIDIDAKRFFDDGRDTVGSPVIPTATKPALAPSSSTGVQNPPTLTFAPPLTNAATNPDKLNIAWMNAGITRPGHWRVVWHIALPGLESISGTLSRTAGGPILLTLPSGPDLTPWITSPELQLGAASTCTLPYPQCVGDFVRVRTFSANANCADLAVVPSTTDVPILAVHPGSPSSIELQAVPGFDPNPACFASLTVGGTFEVHAGETTAGGWMVLQELDVLGRVPRDTQVVITGPRFDYPLDGYPYPNTPLANDIALSFTVSGDPTFAGTIFGFTTESGSLVTTARDPTVSGAPGFAGPILVYSSERRPGDEIFFTAIPGSNSLVEAIPAQFGTTGALRVFY